MTKNNLNITKQEAFIQMKQKVRIYPFDKGIEFEIIKDDAIKKIEEQIRKSKIII